VVGKFWTKQKKDRKIQERTNPEKGTGKKLSNFWGPLCRGGWILDEKTIRPENIQKQAVTQKPSAVMGGWLILKSIQEKPKKENASINTL